MHLALIFATVLHVLVCVILILVVLLQQGGKADLGVFGGSGTQTAFGGAGPATLLHKITVGAAALFMITCLFLSINTGKQIVSGESDVTKKLPNTQPAKPATPPPQPGAPAPGGTATPQTPAPGTPAPQAAPGAETFTVGPNPTPADSGAPKDQSTTPAKPPAGGESKDAPKKPQ